MDYPSEFIDNDFKDKNVEQLQLILNNMRGEIWKEISVTGVWNFETESALNAALLVYTKDEILEQFNS